MIETMLGAARVSNARFDEGPLRVGSLRAGLRFEQHGLYRINRSLLLVGSFFLSWHLLRIPSANFNLSDAAFLAGCFLLLFSGQLNVSIFGRSTGIWIAGLTFMLGGMLIGTLDHGYASRWVIVSSQYVLALVVIPAFLASMNRDLLQRGAMAFVFGTALSQVLGVIALRFFTYDQLLPYFGRTFLRGNGRLGGMAGEPNSNGAVCVFALIILVHAVLGRRISGRVALPVAAAVVAGLVSSASFTAMAAATASVGALVLLSRFRALWKVGLPVALLALAYFELGGPMPSAFEERVGDAVVTMDPSKAGTFTGRTELVEEAWQKADAHLLIGLGTDRYREVSSRGAPVHNLYLLLLNEGGLLSFFGLLTLTCCLFVNAFSLARFDRLDGAACLAITIAFTIYCSSMPHLYDRLWTVPVMLMCAVAMAPGAALHQSRFAAVSPMGPARFEKRDDPWA